MNDKNEYIRQLEEANKQLIETIRQFLKPIKDIPFPIAIKAISGFEVLKFDKRSEADRTLLEKLSRALDLAIVNGYKLGLTKPRPNEVGNKIESFVREAIDEIGISIEIPRNSKGHHQTAGYPDFSIKDGLGRIIYLECKTFNIKTKSSSLRTFYFQASEISKVTSDALHLMTAFEMKQEKRNGINSLVPVHWAIYTLDKLLVQIKHEFNASNKVIYKTEGLLAEGNISDSLKKYSK